MRGGCTHTQRDDDDDDDDNETKTIVLYLCCPSKATKRPLTVLAVPYDAHAAISPWQQ